MRRQQSIFVLSVMAFGYAFLYVPIVSLIVFSFNESRLVTVWSRFSTKWYVELLSNETILHAAWVSLRIALMTATGAVIIGTLAAVAIVRLRQFKARSMFNGLITAPMVMPDVIMGISLLLLFVGLGQLIGWPQGRGMTTITIAHMTVAIAYVVVIVRERLLGFDMSLEEAALDLGARPAEVFLRITLPLIAPSLMAGWLLAFTLSFDDVVIASFMSGPGSTTLPMVVFSSVRLGVSPEINALATIIIGFVTLGIMGAGIFQWRQQRYTRKGME